MVRNRGLTLAQENLYSNWCQKGHIGIIWLWIGRWWRCHNKKRCKPGMTFQSLKNVAFFSGAQRIRHLILGQTNTLHTFSFIFVVILEIDKVPLTRSDLVILKDVKKQEYFFSWYLVLNLEHSDVSLQHALLQSTNISLFLRLSLKFPFDFFTKGKKRGKKERRLKLERWR